MTELESVAALIRQRGLEWCEIKLKADLLEKDRESYFASLVNELRKADPTASEKRLETEAKASREYRDYVRGETLAKHEALVAKVKYEAVQTLFSAKQSDQSLLREQVSKGIFHEGGK